jgi:hypothetical protein
MDGRILIEALSTGDSRSLKSSQKTIEAKTVVGGKRWSQYLKISVVSGRLYFDEGGGESRP